jgi:hypothetical protein
VAGLFTNQIKMETYLAFENFEEKKEAYLIVSEIFNTISKDLKIEGIEKYNEKAFGLVETTSKKIAKQFVDRIIKSHQDWSTEQDEYFDFYEKVKIEIDSL